MSEEEPIVDPLDYKLWMRIQHELQPLLWIVVNDDLVEQWEIRMVLFVLQEKYGIEASQRNQHMVRGYLNEALEKWQRGDMAMPHDEEAIAAAARLRLRFEEVMATSDTLMEELEIIGELRQMTEKASSEELLEKLEIIGELEDMARQVIKILTPEEKKWLEQSSSSFAARILQESQTGASRAL